MSYITIYRDTQDQTNPGWAWRPPIPPVGGIPAAMQATNQTGA